MFPYTDGFTVKTLLRHLNLTPFNWVTMIQSYLKDPVFFLDALFRAVDTKAGLKQR